VLRIARADNAKVSIPLTSVASGCLVLALAGCAADRVGAGNGQPERVQILVDQPGSGRAVVDGAKIVMHYTGWVADPHAADLKGKQFVSSRERGEALLYLYGNRSGIPGLERGLEGMRAGGQRTIFIPAALGYDDRSFPRPPGVPPRSALVFEIDVIEIRSED
jgi:FKBP-type peptidyl-prolyl cis-trans isomerase FkpA